MFCVADAVSIYRPCSHIPHSYQPCRVSYVLIWEGKKNFVFTFSLVSVFLFFCLASCHPPLYAPHLSVSVGLTVYLSVSVGLTVYLSVFVGMAIYLSVFVGMAVHLSVSVGMAVHLSNYVSVYIPFYPRVFYT